MNITKAILNIKAIQFARLSAAQENKKYPAVTIDDESNEALDFIVKLAELYLKCEGVFPFYRTMSMSYSKDHAEGYNEALKDCRISLMKKIEGIENLIMSNWTAMNSSSFCSDLSDKIKAHLLK